MGSLGTCGVFKSEIEPRDSANRKRPGRDDYTPSTCTHKIHSVNLTMRVEPRPHYGRRLQGEVSQLCYIGTPTHEHASLPSGPHTPVQSTVPLASLLK